MESNLKVLVVEDDEVDRRVIRRHLKSSGLEAELVETDYIKEAVQKIESTPFDCILLDHNLPDGTALDLLNQLSPESKKGIPIIILTGGGDEMIAVQLIKNGAMDYIPKNQLNKDSLEGSILKSIKVSNLEKRSQKAEEELKKRELELSSVLEAVPDIIIKLDFSRNITFLNSAVNFLGFDPENLLGKNISELIGSNPSPVILSQICTQRIGPRATTNLEIPFFVNRNSMLYSSMKSVQVLIDSKGLWNIPDEEVLAKDNEKNFLGTLLLAKNLTEQKKIENELRESQAKLKETNAILEKLSNQDGLTGIANRYCFDGFIDREIKRANRDKTVISLVMLDIDYFKKYNDSYGHQAGDDCLIKVAKTLTESLKRPGDLAARYGGEEFAVVLPGADNSGAQAFAEQIRKSVEDMKLEHKTSDASDFVTISLGIYTANPSENATPDLMIEKADKALYKAKKEGRNRIKNGN